MQLENYQVHKATEPLQLLKDQAHMNSYLVSLLAEILTGVGLRNWKFIAKWSLTNQNTTVSHTDFEGASVLTWNLD